MKARHVWFVFAFVLGISIFAFEMAEQGIMWGMYGVMNALTAGTGITAIVLLILGLVLAFCDD